MNQENKTYEAYFTNEFARLLSKFKDANSLYEYISQQIEKDQLEREKRRKEIIYILRKYKWLVPLSMPEPLILDAAKTARRKGNHRAQINKIFIGYFSHNNFEALSNLVETWNTNPLFKQRIEILCDCVSVLKYRSKNLNPSNVVL